MCFFLLSFLLLPILTIAQQPFLGITPWEEITAGLFILVFILILLSIGGVIRLPTGASRYLGKIIFLIILVALFVIPNFVPYPQFMEIPESFKIYRLPPFISKLFSFLGIPDEWLYLPGFIYLFILPFAAIYTLVWAFILELGIFNLPENYKIARTLAFIITFLTIPIGWFIKMVWVLFAFMGAYSVAIFVAMFIIGLFFKGFGVARRFYWAAMTMAPSVQAYGRKMIADDFWRDSDVRRIFSSLSGDNQRLLRDTIDDWVRGVINDDTAKRQIEAISSQLKDKFEHYLRRLQRYAAYASGVPRF